MGASLLPILSGIILMGASSSVILDNTDFFSTDVEQLFSDVFDEISSFLQIKEIWGKYEHSNHSRQISKVIFLVKQFIQHDINISDISLQLISKDDVGILYFSGYCSNSTGQSLFTHNIWSETQDSYSIIVLSDHDDSISKFNIMNDDMVFLAIHLPKNFILKKDESLTITLCRANGQPCSYTLRVPGYHSQDIISFTDY